MKNKLISMTDYVLEQRKKEETDNIRRFWACEKYAKFLKQPLNLGMFVPCDDEGNVLDVPKPIINDIGNCNYQARFKQYQQAKAKVLFKGFFDNNTGCAVMFEPYKPNARLVIDFKSEKYKTIEDLIPYNLTLNTNDN